MLETLVGLARVPIAVEVDPERVRPLDVPAIVGDNQRLRRATDWEPTTPLATTLADLLDATRAAAAVNG
jgi:GDP-4-dehydro-6-deoxy-D-mannose reductase